MNKDDYWVWSRRRSQMLEEQWVNKETEEVSYKYYILRGNKWIPTGVGNFETNDEGKVLELPMQRDKFYTEEKYGW